LFYLHGWFQHQQIEEEEGELPLKEVSPAEKKEQLRWIGYAVYMAARCQKHLKRDDETRTLVKAYNKNFPDGKWRNAMNALPPFK